MGELALRRYMIKIVGQQLREAQGSVKCEGTAGLVLGLQKHPELVGRMAKRTVRQCEECGKNRDAERQGNNRERDIM